jgi:hypothetical protein
MATQVPVVDRRLVEWLAVKKSGWRIGRNPVARPGGNSGRNG